MAKDQHLDFPESKTGTPVYLVYKDEKIYFEPCHEAIIFAGYEGEGEEIYMFFDSAIYIREDYQHIEDDQQ